MSHRRHRRIRIGPSCALVAILVVVTAVQAESRSRRKKSGGVPKEFAAQGTVYHVLPGHDAQVTFTSDAPLEHIKGTTNQVTGYAVVPQDEGVLPCKLVHAEFRMPVKSLDTGIPMRNGHLQSPRWMDAGSYPDVVFTVTKVKDAEVVEEKDGFTTYAATLVGDMTIKASTKEMAVPARITLMPESERTQARAPGDLMAIRCSYTLQMTDFGVGKGAEDLDPGIKMGKVAEELDMETYLFLSTVKPGR